MGITIHFEGQIRNGELPTVLEHVTQFADRCGWSYSPIPEKQRVLLRVRDDKDWNYVGLTSGVEAYPDENCEPLRLEFDENGYIQEYVKTQFSPVGVHISIVELLRELQRWFVKLEVVDESDFWETNEVSSLEAHFTRFFEVLEEEKARNPKLTGPYRMNDGRIIDLWEDD